MQGDRSQETERSFSDGRCMRYDMQLTICDDTLLKAESNDTLFFFDYSTFALVDSAESRDSSGIIPFVHIPQVRVMRAYVHSLNNRSTENRFRDLDDREYRQYFWKVFDDDGWQSECWLTFERQYCLDAVIRWCEENGIGYRIMLSPK